MSALEYVSTDRRNATRIRIAGEVPVLIGRGQGVLMDLSERGAKIRHRTAVLRGSTVRISIEWKGTRFSANAEVLASRVVTLGDNDGGGTTFETRLRFAPLDRDASHALTGMLDDVSGIDVRRWVANLRGWEDEPARVAPLVASGSYLRCRLAGTRWLVKCTRDGNQPADGFVVPAGIPDEEIVVLCDDYVRGGEEERQMIRLFASAAVDHTTLATARLRVVRNE
jgi:hypothetical protein